MPRAPLAASLALVLACLAVGAAGAAQTCWWPEDEPAKQERGAERAPGVSGWLMAFYRNYVSQVDAMRTCPFEPTCGNYARGAIRKHGALLGWIMGCERAIRYHGDTTTYRRGIIDGRLRLLDPVSDNDFWFRRPFRRRQP